MEDNLHSLSRRLIELRIEHADLDNLIDRATADAGGDEIDIGQHVVDLGRDPGTFDLDAFALRVQFQCRLITRAKKLSHLPLRLRHRSWQ
jgi:hypothetical protein